MECQYRNNRVSLCMCSVIRLFFARLDDRRTGAPAPAPFHGRAQISLRWFIAHEMSGE